MIYSPKADGVDQDGRPAARHLLSRSGWRHLRAGRHLDSEHFKSAPRIYPSVRWQAERAGTMRALSQAICKEASRRVFREGHMRTAVDGEGADRAMIFVGADSLRHCPRDQVSDFTFQFLGMRPKSPDVSTSPAL